MTPRLAVLGALLAASTLLAACGHENDDAPVGAEPAVPFPDSLTAYVDQSRLARIGRDVFVRLVHEGKGTVTVTRAEVTSARFGAVTWTGEETFMNEADLPFEMPAGTCGTGADAEVRLTYRLDDGPEQVSTTTATDRYGAIALLLERDCAQATFDEAADLTLGEPRVVGGRGRSSYYELPVTITATGDRDDVSFGGFERTVLFSLRDGSAVWPTTPAVPLTAGTTFRPVLRLVPGRCDPHALAEDKVGTLVPLHVEAPGLADNALFHLPLSDDARATLRRFFATYCDLDVG
ncbi:hypothetical protein ABFT23_12595 [Nocardioides sp. C4-1]|uniref:hypothetical protein n=1 Tax=Nocardioides sp. C4-1 TaxID=3151851 RepID=UPI00326495AC